MAEPETEDQHTQLLGWARQWLRSRDEMAGAYLVETLYPQVIRIVRNHLPRGVDEEDLAQEVFEQFFRTLDRYDERSPLSHWLSKVALYVCLNALRSRKRKPEWRWADLSEHERTIADSLLRDRPVMDEQMPESHELLLRLMDLLNEKDRMVITLLHLEHRHMEEVCALTGWSGVLVRVRSFRAMRRMRKALRALEQG